ncbi:hypothetical protein PPL_01972 [Heterostelium album PN500]|uniref:Ankyrin repeat protein n=1 Tax=Heterostelium pallidum (strain ATCC 26659 / Pp 5 / PN500) TaxID=670386 RepID=D3B104_HETP5|nr:hypothetical protein PPL_01972 [Heterostelium album PN500]EFA84978.1 hypothetical protein PPL_01972 [Heterostelium album PN500]|eukprot:XP_020437088.1 hypothetical protein PPL_01972 [Heterostelium album PN500]
MNKETLLLVLNNVVLQKNIFRQVKEINQFETGSSFSWRIFRRNPRLLTNYKYFDLLKRFFEESKDFLVRNSDGETLLQYDSIFINLAKIGRLEDLKYLWELFDINNRRIAKHISKHYEFSSFQEIFRNAVENNHMEVVKFLMDPAIKFPWSYESALVISPKSKSLEMVQYLSKLFDQHNRDFKKVPKVYDEAAKVGRVDIIEWLIQNRPQDREGNNMYDGAISNKHIHVVQFLLGAGSKYDNTSGNLHGFAANVGQFEMLKLFHQKVSYNRYFSVQVAITGAVRCNNLEMLIWISKNYDSKQLVYPLNLIEIAVENNNLEMVKWLTENTPAMTTHKAMDSAASNNNLEIVKYLHTNRSEGCSSVAFDFSIGKGNMDVFNWLVENRTEQPQCTFRAMDVAAEGGHLEQIKWLHENRSEGCSTDAMDRSARFGHLAVLKWLHENRTEGCSSRILDYTDDFGIAKWICENRTEEFSASDLILNLLGQPGSFEAIKWICENTDVECPENTVEQALANDDMEVAEWMIINRSEFNNGEWRIDSDSILKLIEYDQCKAIAYILEHNLHEATKDELNEFQSKVKDEYPESLELLKIFSDHKTKNSNALVQFVSQDFVTGTNTRPHEESMQFESVEYRKDKSTHYGAEWFWSDRIIHQEVPSCKARGNNHFSAISKSTSKDGGEEREKMEKATLILHSNNIYTQSDSFNHIDTCNQ